MVNCITASGDTLTPMIITRIENFDKIWEKGYRPDENDMLRTSQPAYFDTNLFIEYVNVALIPFMDSIRGNPLYSDEPAVLLIDNCSSHYSDEILQKLAKKLIYVMNFPKHTTNILQMLDLVN